MARQAAPMLLRNRDLNLLLAFEAIFLERNVTHAASRIGRRQSAMSGALTRLREQLGDELFIRTAAGMQPTPRAVDLWEPISTSLRLLEQSLAPSRETFDPAQARREFVLAMTD